MCWCPAHGLQFEYMAKKQYVDLHRRQDGDIEVEELDKVWCCRVP